MNLIHLMNLITVGGFGPGVPAKPYSMLTLQEKLERARLEKQYFEATGRLPRGEIADEESGFVVYSPKFWPKDDTQVRRLDTQSEEANPYLDVCADGRTMCDSRKSICRYCYCNILPSNVNVLGTPVRGNNGPCIWSGCECEQFAP
jgi:hypothetical protein